VLGLFLHRLRREVLWAEGHRLEACWEAGVASGHCDILEEILEFLGERNARVASLR